MDKNYVEIKLEDRKEIARVVAEIIFYLKESNFDIKTIVGNVLDSVQYCKNAIEQAILHFLEQSSYIDEHKKQLIFWEDVLIFVTMG